LEINGPPDFVLKAIKYFEDALAIAPDFSLAYSRLSALLYILGAAGFMSTDVSLFKSKKNMLISHLKLIVLTLMPKLRWG